MHRLLSMAVLLELCLIFSIRIIAQTDSVKNPEQFLFPKFSIGKVSLKDGRDLDLILNYNIVTEKMVFLQRGQLFDMINYEAVDTIYILQRRFIPFGKVFYEVALNGPVSLFIQHKGDIQSPARPAAYGGTSQVSSSTYYNYITLGNDAFRMSSKPEIIITAESINWIRKNNTMYNIVSNKQLLKILFDRKSAIRQYIRANLLNTKNSDDLLKVINYYNTLIN
jgi:hypothetical protein